MFDGDEPNVPLGVSTLSTILVGREVYLLPSPTAYKPEHVAGVTADRQMVVVPTVRISQLDVGESILDRAGYAGVLTLMCEVEGEVIRPVERPRFRGLGFHVKVISRNYIFVLMDSFNYGIPRIK